jgi:TatD DNase family protein
VLIDAHNHLHDAWFAPLHPTLLAELAAIGVRYAVVNGTSEADWADVASLAAGSIPELTLLPSYGLHPWDVGNRAPDWQKNLLHALGLDGIKNSGTRPMIGEFGLDRWILDRARPDDWRLKGLRRASLEEQTEAFLWQIDLAATHNLPASLHCIDAWGQLYDLLRQSRRPNRGFLLHAYSGPDEMVKPFAELGAYFSFNGNFLEPRRTRLREVFANLPTDRLLVETDAPAMRLPVTHERFAALPTPDGQPANHPGNIAATYAALAVIRGVPLEALTTQVEENFRRLFLA